MYELPEVDTVMVKDLELIHGYRVGYVLCVFG